MRAARTLERLRVEQARRAREQPARWANITRNAAADIDRARRWRPARDAMWRVLSDHVALDGARIAVVGAGNAHDVPLTRLAHVAREVVLLDLDPSAPRAARRREPRSLRRRIAVVEHDATAGAADTIVAAAATGEAVDAVTGPDIPLPGAPYDLVVGDLLYSQLLYPGLRDLGVDDRTRRATLARHESAVTRAVVAGMHASAGTVLHVHDPLLWTPENRQPVSLDAILAAAERDVDAALALASRGHGPAASDPRHALRELSIPALATTLWRWPFALGVDYLVCATLARSGPDQAVSRPPSARSVGIAWERPGRVADVRQPPRHHEEDHR